MSPISNSDLDEIITLDNEINEATSISTTDIKKTKITLIEVDGYVELMRYLKEFTNFLEVLFTQKCPLWRSTHGSIDKLTDYTTEEHAEAVMQFCG